MYQLDALERQYLDHHRALGHSIKTVSHYSDSFASFHRFLIERTYPESAASITTAIMNEFASWLRNTPTRGWRGRTERSEFGLHGTMKDLRAFCNWLVEAEHLERAPKVQVPNLPQTFSRPCRSKTCSRSSPPSSCRPRRRSVAATGP